MSFRNRSKADNPSRIVLPITPMLDMTFQLLFFFIVNFRPAPAMVEGALEMALPTEQTTSKPNEAVVKPHDDLPPIEFPSDVTVKVRPLLDDNTDKGSISSLFLMDNEGKETPVEGKLPELKAALIAKRELIGQKSNIKVQAGGQLKVKYVMQVMDVCKQAGFDNVSMVPPEDFQR